MRKNSFFKKKFNLFYLFPIYLAGIILLISLVFYFINYESNNTIFKNNQISEGNKSPEIKVKMDNETIQTVRLDEYLIGVVSAEMPPGFENEALKAQAVAARTYIINKKDKENDVHPDSDVCTDSSHCKAYISYEDAEKKWGEDWINKYYPKISSCVNETAGEIVTYNDEPIIAVFHSTSSGRTENSEDVWQTATPYLKSVESPGEELSPRYKSEEEFSLEDFKKIIKNLNPQAEFSGDKNNWINSYSHTEGGSVKKIIIGGCEFSGTEIRNAFSLRSADFIIEINEKVKFMVTGNGHGVGMSQYGANYAALQGQNYKEILMKYYKDTDIKKIY